jgi:hypothetical protein
MGAWAHSGCVAVVCANHEARAQGCMRRGDESLMCGGCGRANRRPACPSSAPPSRRLANLFAVDAALARLAAFHLLYDDIILAKFLFKPITSSLGPRQMICASFFFDSVIYNHGYI